MVLVTGGTGILGRVLLLELLKLGKNVRATKRKTSNLNEVRDSLRYYTENSDAYFNKIEWIDVDFEDQFSLNEALTGVTEVYHSAAKVSFSPNDEREMIRTNIEGTQNLLYACENSSVKKFLFVSSIAVLDNANENGIYTEESDFNSKLDHSSYAISKHFSEMEVWRANAEGLPCIIVNPGLIIGSGNWSASSGELFTTYQKTKYTSSGSSSYVDVRDVAKASIKLMEKEYFGERYILVSEQKKFEAIGNQIRAKLGLSNVKVISDSLLHFLRILRPLGLFVPKLKLLTKTNIEAITSHNIISSEKVKKTLDFQFIPVSESLDFHLNHFIKDHKK